MRPDAPTPSRSATTSAEGRDRRVAIPCRPTGGQRGTAAFPPPCFHADLELLAEQVGRGGFHTGALRRAAPQRQGCTRASGIAGRPDRCVLPARKGEKAGQNERLTEAGALQRG